MKEMAQAYLETIKDMEAASVYVCPTCGYTVIGDRLDKCSICGVKKERFSQF